MLKKIFKLKYLIFYTLLTASFKLSLKLSQQNHLAASITFEGLAATIFVFLVISAFLDGQKDE